jgi:putative acetyltransferase
MSAPTIRTGTDADGEAIGAVLAAVFAEYPGCVFVPGEFPELAAVATHYAGRGGALWVVEHDRSIVGSCAVFRSASASFELSKVYLRREARGAGLARQMLERVIEFARGQGGHRLELFTDTRFLDGHRFYERNGFVRLPGERFIADQSDSWEYHYERWL